MLQGAREASRFNAGTVFIVLLAVLAVLLNFRLQSNTQLATAVVVVGLVGGVAIAYVMTAKMLRSVEDNGEYKLPFPPVLLSLAIVVFWAVFPYFAGGFIRSWTLQGISFFVVFMFSLAASISVSTIWFCRRWEHETNRQLLSEDSFSTMRFFVSPKPQRAEPVSEAGRPFNQAY